MNFRIVISKDLKWKESFHHSKVLWSSQVEAKCWNQCLVLLILEPGQQSRLFGLFPNNKPAISNVLNISHRRTSDLILFNVVIEAEQSCWWYFTEAMRPMCTHYISDFSCWKLHKITVKDVQLVVTTLSAGSALYNSSHCQVKSG